MNDVAKNQDEKEEIKKASKTEIYENYEDEAMENSAEGSGMEEVPFSDISLPHDTHEFKTPSQTDNTSSEESLNNIEARKKALLKEKWSKVTGKKPNTIPVLKPLPQDEREYLPIQILGNRWLAYLEKRRKEKWSDLAAAQTNIKAYENLGKVNNQIRLSAMCRGLTCIRFESNGESLSTSCLNGGVQVRNTTTGESIISLKTRGRSENLAVRSLRYHPKSGSQLYLAGEVGVVEVFQVESAESLGTSEQIKPINCMDFNLAGSVLVTGGWNGKVTLLDASTLQVVSVRSRPNIECGTTAAIEDEFHKLQIQSVKFHPSEPNLFVTGGFDCTVKVWDVRIPGAVLSLRGPFICGDAIDVEKNYILTGEWTADNSLKLWDFSSGKLIQTIPIHIGNPKYEGEFLYVARFFSNPQVMESKMIIVAGSGFKEVSVINMEKATIVASFPAYKPVSSLDFFDKNIAYGGKESVLRIGEVQSLRRRPY